MVMIRQEIKFFISENQVSVQKFLTRVKKLARFVVDTDTAAVLH